MSTHVTGFRPPDEHWQKLKAVWDACEAAKLPIPDEVADFFNWEPPDPAGVEVVLPVREWHGGEAGAGYELDLEAIPPGVKTIRFWNSW